MLEDTLPDARRYAPGSECVSRMFLKERVGGPKSRPSGACPEPRTYLSKLADLVETHLKQTAIYGKGGIGKSTLITRGHPASTTKRSRLGSRRVQGDQSSAVRMVRLVEPDDRSRPQSAPVN